MLHFEVAAAYQKEVDAARYERDQHSYPHGFNW